MKRPMFALFALATAWGCGGGSLEPQEIPLDRVNCARCGMLISDDTHAAQAVSHHEDPRFYDDVGCLANDAAVKSGDYKLYVRTSQGWADATTAVYLRQPEVRTPMGYGLIAMAPTAAGASSGANWQDVLSSTKAQP